MAMSEILKKPRDASKHAPDYRWVLPNCFIGVELEYENVILVPDETNSYWGFWSMHRDDSLKMQGQEFVFKNPLFGIDAYNALTFLMTQAFAKGYKCTRRAGIHIHLDVRDMETVQWVGFIILYAILEPVLFNWVGDNRENSIFCVPFYKADESLGETCALVRAALDDDQKATNTILGTAKNFARYAALNLQALAKFGSVEFRHLKTTHDIQRVFDWINMIMSLKAAVIKFPTSDGVILHMAQETEPREFLEMVFGRELGNKLWHPSVPNLLIEKGFPTARDIVLFGLNHKPWDGIELPKGSHEGFRKFLIKAKDMSGPSSYRMKSPRLRDRPPRGIIADEPEQEEALRERIEQAEQRIRQEAEEMAAVAPAAPQQAQWQAGHVVQVGGNFWQPAGDVRIQEWWRNDNGGNQ